MERDKMILKAYKNIDMPIDDTTLKEVIDDICDDFKSRMCKNCKKSTPFYDMYERLEGYYCKDPLFKGSFTELPKNYGCNKFKLKAKG